MSDKKDYILGTDVDELERLGFQHRVWSKDAFALWDWVGLGLGQRVLDLGCGPGFATLDLATIVGPKGQVVGLDMSPKYIAYARSRARVMNLTNVELIEESLGDMWFEPESFDAIYTRWAFAWINNVEDVVRRACTFLRPGGFFLSQEYLQWGTFRLMPDRQEVSTVIEAARESWRIMDSEIDIARFLPALFNRNGLEVVRAAPIAKVSRPGQMAWQWLATFLEIYSPKLVNLGLLEMADREAFLEVWPKVEADPDSMLVAPLVMEVVGRKRS